MMIRPASQHDLVAITQIGNALLADTTYEWTEIPHADDDRAQWLADHEQEQYPVLVAVDDDVVVGWASFEDFRDSKRRPGYRFTVEHSVHVLESHWGKGVGRALMVGLADRARSDGKRVMVAAIDASNLRSIAFHGALGFSEVGRMPGIGEKWGQRLDLVLMQVDLDRSLGW
jgi:L-amino acid N-acyltransferase YncA